MENITSMSEILLELRTKKGVTQEEAAANFGVSNKTVSKWETGASLPETEYLAGIADYYGVSVDELFGRESSGKDIRNIIWQQYNDLSKSETIIKSFQIAHDSIITLHAHWEKRETDSLDLKQLFGYPEYFNRSLFSTNDAFDLLLNSKHANMAVMLAGNEDDFSWLTEKAGDYLPLLKFLSNLDAIKLFRLMHNQKFPAEFTADFIAKAAGIDENRAAEILDEAVKFQICYVNEMDLKDGLTKLYNSSGNGFILSALTLIYEWACGERYYHNNHHWGEKLIRGDK